MFSYNLQIACSNSSLWENSRGLMKILGSALSCPELRPGPLPYH